MTSYKLTDLNSDILNKIYEEITNRNKGEIREIAVFKESYKKYMEKKGFNPKHFRKMPGCGDGEYDVEITSTYQVCLDYPEFMDANEVGLMIDGWIVDEAADLPSNEKNNIICWYGMNKAYSLFIKYIKNFRHDINLDKYLQDDSFDPEMELVYLILCEVVEFNPSSEWRNNEL
jgi:hypothetical protein